MYELDKCSSCGLAYVVQPDLDYGAIYSREYYDGKGADPLVDYCYELESPERTIRRLEWRGIYRVMKPRFPSGRRPRWLDFGCGGGGLVRFLRERGVDAEGYDQGEIVDDARARGIPILRSEELASRRGAYDVVSAIEVAEHVAAPRAFFEQVAGLLAPGGTFFYTTGNAERFAADLIGWSYFVPEIHIRLFQPKTAERALRDAGLVPNYSGWRAGFADIIAFRILKVLKVRDASWIAELLAHSPLPWLVDRKYGVSGFPVGSKPA